jgi:hypothetical protein
MACYTSWDIGGCGCAATVSVCGCAVDPSATLHGSHTSLGAFTLTYAAGGGTWTGTSTYSYPGCSCDPPGTGGCPAASITLHWELDPAVCTLTLTFRYSDAPQCPDDAGDTAAEVVFPTGGIGMVLCDSDAPTVACSPLNLSYTGCLSCDPTGPCCSIYGTLCCNGGAADTVTLTT